MTGQKFEQVQDKSVSLVTNLDELVVPTSDTQTEARSIESSNIDAASGEEQCPPSNNEKLRQNSDFPDLGDRYEVLEQIGAGGMGTVWKVHDRTLDKILAIKILRRELLKDTTAVKRFEQESKLATDLTHVNIASVYGSGTDKAGDLFIIMNYVDGESLTDILAREGKLTEERAMDIFHQICAALTHSHMKGVIHRDIEPSNIIISKTASGADLVHVVDFGIAKSIYGDVQSTQALTRTEDALGSPLYISPEQCLGEEVTEQSDIYSLGCVLYEMLTGAPPFKEKNPVKLLLQHLHDQPDYSNVPKKAIALINLCLQKDKRSRPKRVEDLVDYYCDDRIESRDFNGSSGSQKCGMVAPATLLLVFSSPGIPHQSLVDSFLSLFLLWCVFMLFWLTLAIANVNTAIRSTTVRVLEQSLFVACLIAPVLTIFNFATGNSYSSIATLGSIAILIAIMQVIGKTDIYDRMFFWRRKNIWSQRLESSILPILSASLKMLAWTSIIGAVLLSTCASQIWRIAADVIPPPVQELAELSSALIISVFLLVLADLMLKCDWPSELRKVLLKTSRSFVIICSLLVFSFTLLSSQILDPAYTSFIRQQRALNSEKPAALQIQHEVLDAPHTAVGDLARVVAVSKILAIKSHHALSSEILKQVLANDDTVPLLCAIAYQQLAELTARTSGWKEATTYFEKSLEQLREPEQSIGWQNPQWTLAFSAWHRSRAECALDLARLANANKDVDRAKVAINFLENTKLEMTTFQRQELNYMKETLGTTYLIHDTVKPQVVPSAPQSPSR